MARQARKEDWSAANRRYLLAALETVVADLLRHAGTRDVPPPPDLGALAASMAAPPALEVVCGLFGLSPFERRVLLLCAGVELDSRVAELCAEAKGAARGGEPTFGLALAAFEGAHWAAVTPAAPLRYWRLVDTNAADGPIRSPLRIDERILHELVGVRELDAELACMVRGLRPAPALAPSHAAVAREVASIWAEVGSSGPLPVVQLCGREVNAKRAIAAEIARTLRDPVWLLPAEGLPVDPVELEACRRRWQRESALSGAILLLDAESIDPSVPRASSGVTRFVEETGGPVLLATTRRLGPFERPTLRLDVADPTPGEQRELWRAALGDLAPRLDAEVDRLVHQFRLGAPVVEAACRGAAGRLAERGGNGRRDPRELGTALWDFCRLQARPELDDLAERVETVATFDDLILPEDQMALLREIEAQVRLRSRVYGEWGFGRGGRRGLGVSALFSGPSGTGKTLAAEALAGALGLDLYRIDLSAVVSKYIGETEKNLRRVFDAAEAGGAVLLFDEADALFGKRSEVKDSHDRHANIEVGYLLQRLESYHGLAILTTNLKDAIDRAFLRRLRFLVSFPFPEEAEREAMWRLAFPPATPTRGLDPAKLAHLNVPGGNLRNIALNAAFVAAASDGAVGMEDVRRAARLEYLKLERTLTAKETRDW